MKELKEIKEDKPKTVHEQLVYIQKELKAPKGQRNSFGNYNYRSCEDIVEAVKPLLNEMSLLIIDEIVMVGTRYYVKAIATLTDGVHIIQSQAFAREADSKKGMDEAQITGSASSYARKYALNGLFAIDDTKDADTNEITKASHEEPDPTDSWEKPQEEASTSHVCPLHNATMKERFAPNGGHYFDHRLQGILSNDNVQWNKDGDWYWCQGKGWHLSAKQ